MYQSNRITSTIALSHKVNHGNTLYSQLIISDKTYHCILFYRFASFLYEGNSILSFNIKPSWHKHTCARANRAACFFRRRKIVRIIISKHTFVSMSFFRPVSPKLREEARDYASRCRDVPAHGISALSWQDNRLLGKTMNGNSWHPTSARTQAHPRHRLLSGGDNRRRIRRDSAL